MISAQRIFKQALELSTAAFLASEDTFRSIFGAPYPEAEQDKLWAQWNDANNRPSIALGYARGKVTLPQWRVVLAGDSAELEFLGFGGAAEDGSIVLQSQATELLRVYSLGRTPDEAWFLRIVAEQAIRYAHKWIMGQGITGFYYGESQDITPTPMQDLSPAEVYQTVTSWRCQVPKTLLAPAAWADDWVTSVLVMKQDYYDDEDREGGITGTGA